MGLISDHFFSATSAKTGFSMTVLEKIAKLVDQISPDCICDDCITQKLNLSVRQHANHKTRQLANGKAFHRQKEPCGYCGKAKLSISYSG